MGKTIREITAEVREVNTALGWRDERKSFGDCIALIHSELSEALEAYRDHRLADATGPVRPIFGSEEDEFGNYPIIARTAKPEGVGSELADVLIRVLDTADMFGLPLIEPDHELLDVTPFVGPFVGPRSDGVESFGDHVAWLHLHAGYLWSGGDAPRMLRALVTVAEKYGFDLTAEYERKIAYNRTRPYQHGGRTVADTVPTP
jgi:hypothetical protein